MVQLVQMQLVQIQFCTIGFSTKNVLNQFFEKTEIKHSKDFKQSVYVIVLRRLLNLNYTLSITMTYSFFGDENVFIEQLKYLLGEFLIIRN